MQNAVNSFAVRNREVGSDLSHPNILSYVSGAPMVKIQKVAQKSIETF